MQEPPLFIIRLPRVDMRSHTLPKVPIHQGEWAPPHPFGQSGRPHPELNRGPLLALSVSRSHFAQYPLSLKATRGDAILDVNLYINLKQELNLF